ncbi:MAG: hypothetical protein AB1736_00190 [Chloroflexota bacterium]
MTIRWRKARVRTIGIDDAGARDAQGTGMEGNKRRRAVRNAGAFLAPDGTIGVPMRTLSDDYEDRPVDPEDDRVPEPDPPGAIRRNVNRIVQAWRRGR